MRRVPTQAHQNSLIFFHIELHLWRTTHNISDDILGKEVCSPHHVKKSWQISDEVYHNNFFSKFQLQHQTNFFPD